MILFTRLFNFNYVCADYASDIIRKKILTFLKKDRIIKEIVDYCCSEKIVSKVSFIFCRQRVTYKHHENFSLT